MNNRQPMVGCRVPHEWHAEILAIGQATGQTKGEIVKEALAIYLKKAKAPSLRSRLDDLEQRLNKLALLVTQ